jgi:hypothetical protein
MYGGRFDMFAEFQDAMFVEDDKTTSQLGPSWMKNWVLDSQFTGYCFAAREFGHTVAGAIIRGLSILKSGYGHAQAIVYRPDWMIERWYENLLRTIEDMIRTWEQERYIYALDKHSCNAYGGCGFSRLCESPNPQGWLEMYYEPRIWNPLAKGDETVEKT